MEKQIILNKNIVLTAWIKASWSNEDGFSWYRELITSPNQYDWIGICPIEDGSNKWSAVFSGCFEFLEDIYNNVHPHKDYHLNELEVGKIELDLFVKKIFKIKSFI